MVQKRKTKKVILTVLLVLVLVGLAYGGWYFFVKPKNTASLETTEETKKQAEQSDVERAKSEDNKNSNQGSTGGQQQSTTQSSSVSVNISSAGQSGSTVYVNALVSGTTSGTCKLTMTKNSNKVEKSASIGFQVSYYICKGFNISSSEFAEKGEWEAVIEATGTNGSGKSEVRKVTIQ